MHLDDGKELYLVCVSPDSNANRYYKIKREGEKLVCTYGRVQEPRTQQSIKPYSVLNKLYRSKTNRKKLPYTDMTELLQVDEPESDPDPVEVVSVPTTVIQDDRVTKFAQFLRDRSRTHAQAKLSVELDSVTPRQVSASLEQLKLIAQAKEVSLDAANHELTKQFSIIPRFISRYSGVADAMFTGNSKHDDDILDKEYELLEQLKSITKQPQQAFVANEQYELGVCEDDAITQRFYEGLVGQYSNAKVVQVYTAINSVAEQNFKDLGNINLFWHGSKIQNWDSILANNLLVRPTGVPTTGAMFGHGIYFADVSQKSIGYTDGGFWAGGLERYNVISLYEVALGNVKQVKSGTAKIESAVKEGHDSLWVHGKTRSSQSHLWNDEIIIPSGRQSRVRYVVQFTMN